MIIQWRGETEFSQGFTWFYEQNKIVDSIAIFFVLLAKKEMTLSHIFFLNSNYLRPLLTNLN